MRWKVTGMQVYENGKGTMVVECRSSLDPLKEECAVVMPVGAEERFTIATLEEWRQLSQSSTAGESSTRSLVLGIVGSDNAVVFYRLDKGMAVPEEWVKENNKMEMSI